MINITEQQKLTEKADSTHKELKLVFKDSEIGTITNDRIYSESMELVESLCDMENLTFGQCESSQFSIQVADVTNTLKGKEFQAILAYTDHEISLGYFYITEVGKATDMRYKNLVCYDRMYQMNVNVYSWYNSLFPNVTDQITLKQLRDSFFEYIGFEQEDIDLPNDNMIVTKTLDDTELSGIRIIQSICEVNGVFGHFNRYGVFEYVNLNNRFSKYPSDELYPSSNVFPGSEDAIEIDSSEYIPPSERGEYTVIGINKLQIHEQEDDIGVIVRDTSYDEEDNCYVLTDNFLLYGKSHDELLSIANNILYAISGIYYIPHTTNVIGMPYIEVGDKFKLSFTNESFTSFVIKRTLHGIQALRDTWEAQGTETIPEVVIGANQEVVQLQSRVNILRRTVDGNYLEVTKKIADTDGTVSTLSSVVEQTAEQISLKVSKDSIVSEINASTEGIKIMANMIELQGYVTVTDLSGSGTTTVNGSRISGGTITLGGNNNGNGVFSVNDASNNEIIYMDKDGISIKSGTVNISNLLEKNDFITLVASNNAELKTLIGPNHLTLNDGDHGSNSQSFISSNKISNYQEGVGTEIRGGQLYFTNNNIDCGGIYGDSDGYMRIYGGSQGIGIGSNAVIRTGADILFEGLNYKSLSNLMTYAVNHGWI